MKSSDFGVDSGVFSRLAAIWNGTVSADTTGKLVSWDCSYGCVVSGSELKVIFIEINALFLQINQNMTYNCHLIYTFCTSKLLQKHNLMKNHTIEV